MNSARYTAHGEVSMRRPAGLPAGVEECEGGPIAWAIQTLRDQGMPWAEIDAILGTDDPQLVGRYLELHRERLEERVAEQGATLASIESLLAIIPPSQCRGGSRSCARVVRVHPRVAVGSGRCR